MNLLHANVKQFVPQNLEFHVVEVPFRSVGPGGHNERSRERPVMILCSEKV